MVEVLGLHCGGAVEDVGRVEDVLGREVEPDGHRNGHDEDDVTPAAPAPKGGAEREAAMTHDAAGCALLACELCDAYGSGWAAGVQVCEGLADGLALAARDPWPAVVMGGTASYRNRDLARWLAGLGPVQVWSDGDRAGVEASGVLAKRVAALGGRASIERVGVGEDPGAAGAPFAPLDVVTVEDYAPTWSATGCPAGRPCAWRPRAHERVGEPHMNRVETQCWVIPKRPVYLLLGYMGAGMVLYALLAVVANLIPQVYTLLHATVGTWGVAWWATVGVGLLHEWYDGVAEGWLSPRLQMR